MSYQQKNQPSAPTTMTFSGVLSGQIEMDEKNYKLSVTDNYGNKYDVKISLTPVNKKLQTISICWEGGRQVPC